MEGIKVHKSKLKIDTDFDVGGIYCVKCGVDSLFNTETAHNSLTILVDQEEWETIDKLIWALVSTGLTALMFGLVTGVVGLGVGIPGFVLAAISPAFWENTVVMWVLFSVGLLILFAGLIILAPDLSILLVAMLSGTAFFTFFAILFSVVAFIIVTIIGSVVAFIALTLLVASAIIIPLLLLIAALIFFGLIALGLSVIFLPLTILFAPVILLTLTGSTGTVIGITASVLFIGTLTLALILSPFALIIGTIWLWVDLFFSEDIEDSAELEVESSLPTLLDFNNLQSLIPDLFQTEITGFKDLLTLS